MEKINSPCLGVKEVMLIFRVKESSAYKIISKLNMELKAQGYLITAGRVPKNYLKKRYNI